MIPGVHVQPPAIQVFCEGIADQIIGFIRQNPIVGVIAAIALAILGMAAFAHLPVLLPGMIIIELISILGVFACEIGGMLSAMYFSLQIQDPLIGMAVMATAIGLVMLGFVGMGSFPDQFPMFEE